MSCLLHDSRRFMHLRHHCSQSTKGKKKKPWHSINVKAPIYLTSALEKTKQRRFLEEKKIMKSVLRFNVIKHNSSERLRSGWEDVDVIRAVRWWCCCCCCLDALVCVSLGPVKDALTRALSYRPIPKDGSPPLEKRAYPLSPLYPGSNQNLLAPHSFFTQEQSHVKARALTNLLWSGTLTLPDARPLTPSSSSAQRGANDIMYKNQDLKSPEIQRTRSILSVR